MNRCSVAETFLCAKKRFTAFLIGASLLCQGALPHNVSRTKWAFIIGRARGGMVVFSAAASAKTPSPPRHASIAPRCPAPILHLLAERLDGASQGAAVMDAPPRSANSPGGRSITHQSPPRRGTPPPRQCDQARMQIRRPPVGSENQ